MTARARFTQADIRRAAAGATAAGLDIAKIVIDPAGQIIILPAAGNASAENDDEWADLA